MTDGQISLTNLYYRRDISAYKRPCACLYVAVWGGGSTVGLQGAARHG